MAYITDTEFRHIKIAELLDLKMVCNMSDTEEAYGWTTPSMAYSVCNPLHMAVRGMLDADYDNYLDAHAEAIDGGKQPMPRSEFKEAVMEQFNDDIVVAPHAVTSSINIVINDNPPTGE